MEEEIKELEYLEILEMVFLGQIDFYYGKQLFEHSFYIIPKKQTIHFSGEFKGKMGDVYFVEKLQ